MFFFFMSLSLSLSTTLSLERASETEGEDFDFYILAGKKNDHHIFVKIQESMSQSMMASEFTKIH